MNNFENEILTLVREINNLERDLSSEERLARIYEGKDTLRKVENIKDRIERKIRLLQILKAEA